MTKLPSLFLIGLIAKLIENVLHVHTLLRLIVATDLAVLIKHSNKPDCKLRPAAYAFRPAQVAAATICHLLFNW